MLSSTMPITMPSEEEAARKQMVLLEKEMKCIQEEMREVQAVLDGFDKQRELRLKEQKPTQEISTTPLRMSMEETGRNVWGCGARWFGLRNSDGKIDEMFNDRCTCVAVGGTTTLVLYEDGAVSYTGGLTEGYAGLFDLLHPRRQDASPPTYIALGSTRRYYIKFANGKSEWEGPEKLTEFLAATPAKVRTVAFGEDWSTFFVVYDDGSWKPSGNVPEGLLEQLKKLDNDLKGAAKVRHVTLGPQGEWYLRIANGRAWLGGLPNSFYEHIESIRDSISAVYFGDEGSFFARHF